MFPHTQPPPSWRKTNVSVHWTISVISIFTTSRLSLKTKRAAHLDSISGHSNASVMPINVVLVGSSLGLRHSLKYTHFTCLFLMQEAYIFIFKGLFLSLLSHPRLKWSLSRLAWKPKARLTLPGDISLRWGSTPLLWPPALWCSPGNTGSKICGWELTGTGQSVCLLNVRGR